MFLEINYESYPKQPLERYGKPTWEMVKEAIKKLGQNGVGITVSLETAAKEFLMVTGGQGGYYLIGSEQKHGWQNLINRKNEGREFELIAGGQIADYPGIGCVTLEEALQIFKYFLDNRSLSPDFEWDNPPKG